MGATNSKAERSTALKLCKERKRFIKQAIDSRYALAVAHVSYVQSLRNIGIALRRYAEAEVLVDKTNENDKTPSPFSYPSPFGGISDSPVLNGSPLSPSNARVSYMKSSGASTMTVTMNPPLKGVYLEEGEFPMPPPPPPLPEPGESWDYFNPSDESFRFVGHNGLDLDFDDVRMYGNFGKKDIVLDRVVEGSVSQNVVSEVKYGTGEGKVKGSNEIVTRNGAVECSNSRKTKSAVEKESSAQREDPSEFITHRAKDFLSSIKDIDNRFFRASESGKEVSRMLESGKIHVGYADARGTSSASFHLASLGISCCQCTSTNKYDDQHATKVITWKRTTSSRSSSSRNPLAAKDDNDDSGSDFIEEFCMISGSHSSSLERLYAWERKLYDEVKACEYIQKEYDRKCDQLRHHSAKDLSPQVIDKTRAVVKDLHSRIGVALQAVDSISKRIEKIREEELLPQLLELTQGLTRMWKAMLECHHSQYITISLAYHAQSSPSAPQGENQRQIISQLQEEVEYFGLSFADWVNSYTSYIESLNSWLQNCISQPRERVKGRRAFSPRRYLAPPIFVLCRDWSSGIKSLPSQEVSDAFKTFLLDLQHSVRHQAEESNKTETGTDLQPNESGGNSEVKNEGPSSNMSCIKASLTKVLDRLTKFSEASVKMCEDIKQKCESARNAYDNYKAPPRSFSI